ncbi:MAG: 16S rRNA (guanine(966)-N(2))-methyltransferase RsmD [Clostridia bacterium]|nr:16S rRNA (guanine(966)-N(2))-methyltransferase RsmD [Clostridia bacterium]
MRVISGTARGTKLNSIDDLSTRPTLDRVKEPLFSIIQAHIPDANILDLFAGSGALGIEALSRGSKYCVFCDKSYKSINMLKQNIEKTKFQNQCSIVNEDYKKCIDNQKMKFDITFIDPPYKYDIGVDAIERILKQNLLSKEGIIVLETDEEDRDIKELKKIDLEVYDVRKYGRVKLIFLRERG